MGDRAILEMWDVKPESSTGTDTTPSRCARELQGMMGRRYLFSVPEVMPFLGLGHVKTSHDIDPELGWRNLIWGPSTVLMHMAHTGLSQSVLPYTAPVDGGHDKADPDCLSCCDLPFSVFAPPGPLGSFHLDRPL